MHEIASFFFFLPFCRRILHRDLKSKNIFLKNNLLKIGKIFLQYAFQKHGRIYSWCYRHIMLKYIVSRSVRVIIGLFKLLKFFFLFDWGQQNQIILFLIIWYKLRYKTLPAYFVDSANIFWVSAPCQTVCKWLDLFY